jgi:XTP/dITP diphosphohydrolase
MTRILVATTNPAKLAEYRILLRGLKLEVLSLRDVAIGEHPEETGATFAENALIKARFYFARAGIATIADDGGLEVDALGGAPGVKSHRWLGAGASNSDADLAAEVISRMAGIAPQRRTARLRAATALIYDHGGKRIERIAEAAIEGTIAPQVHRAIREGFPYRAVLMVGAPLRYLCEMGPDEAAAISQRRVALKELRPDLERIAAAAD